MNNTQLIIDMYKNGVGINKISAILKLSILEIPQCLDNSNIDYRDNKYKDRDSNICDMYKNNTHITEIAYGGKLQIIKIFQYLYKDATIYLERKFNKFNNLLPS